MSPLQFRLHFPASCNDLPGIPCRESILTTHCLASAGCWNPNIGLQDLFTATFCISAESTMLTAWPNSVSSSLLSQLRWPPAQSGKNTLLNSGTGNPFNLILRSCLNNLDFLQIRASDWWALALSVPVQGKRFLFNDVSLSVNRSCFPSIPCLWL